SPGRARPSVALRPSPPAPERSAEPFSPDPRLRASSSPASAACPDVQNDFAPASAALELPRDWLLPSVVGSTHSAVRGALSRRRVLLDRRAWPYFRVTDRRFGTRVRPRPWPLCDQSRSPAIRPRVSRRGQSAQDGLATPTLTTPAHIQPDLPTTPPPPSSPL